MRFNDTVDVLEATAVDDHGTTVYDWSLPVVVATLPAHVGHVSVAVFVEPGSGAMVEQLQVIVEPFAYNPARQRFDWKGHLYVNDGPPMLRRRNGADHHLTIALQPVDG